MAELLLDTFLNCPICLVTFTEPVTLGCHHSFCSSCLRDYWDQNNTKNCPVCRRRSSKDHPLVNFAVKELSLSFSQKKTTTAQRENDQVCPQTEQEVVCSRHPEVPHLFCKDEGRALCPVCEFSQHQRHTVVSMEEVEEELQVKIRSDLEALTQQRERLMKRERKYEEIIQHSKNQVEQCQHQITALFSQLHQFLLDEEHKAMKALREEHERQTHTISQELWRLKEQLASVDHTIQDMKGLLQRDTGAFLKTYNYIQSETKAHSSQPDLQPSTGLLIDQAKVLGNLGFRVWRKMRSEVNYSPVILDPNTAHRYLHLSEDLRGVRLAETKQQVPDNPERFTQYPIVLGYEGFSSGIHQWDVKVGDHSNWGVGVMKESFERKEDCENLPKNGVWCLGHDNGTYSDVVNTPLKLQSFPERVRVLLDYDRGQLTFTDADHMTPICSYTEHFSGKVFPVLFVGKTDEAEIKIGPSEAEKV